MDMQNFIVSYFRKTGSTVAGYARSDSFDPLERLDDDWRHVETVSSEVPDYASGTFFE